MCACISPATFDAGMLVFSLALLCLQGPGIVAIERGRGMHSSRIWRLDLGAWRCVRQVSQRGEQTPVSEGIVRRERYTQRERGREREREREGDRKIESERERPC